MIRALHVHCEAGTLTSPGRRSRIWPAAVRWLRLGVAGFGGLISPALFMTAPGVGAPAAAYQEHQVKAELLANFAAFVTWPAGTFPAANSPVVIGVMGKDAFDHFLEKAVEAPGRPGRPLKLSRVTTDAEMRQCQVLFVASSERRRLRDLRERLKGAPVLSVGETEDFLDHGGVINFLLKGQSVRFEISVASAQAAGLKVDAKLLGVANAVRGKYE